jgi:hypothetical protein
MLRITRIVIAAALAAGLCAGEVRAGVVLNPGDLVVSDQESQGGLVYDGALVRVNPTTGAQTMISSGGLLNDPVGVAVDGAGRILVADFNSGGGGALIRVDPLTGAQSLATAAPLSGQPRGVAIAPSGMIYVSCDNGKIVAVNPVSGAQTTVSAGPPLLVPEQMAFDGSGKLVVADAQAGGPTPDGPGGAVIGVDVTSGTESLLNTNPLHLAIGVAVEPSGAVLVSDFPGPPSSLPARVSRLDRASGTLTPLSTGGALVRPGQMTIDEDGRLLVVDQAAYGSGGVIAIDRLTGAQSAVSSGGFFSHPSGVAVVVAPEPAALSLVLFALPAVILRRRRSDSSPVPNADRVRCAARSATADLAEVASSRSRHDKLTPPTPSDLRPPHQVFSRPAVAATAADRIFHPVRARGSPRPARSLRSGGPARSEGRGDGAVVCAHIGLGYHWKGSTMRKMLSLVAAASLAVGTMGLIGCSSDKNKEMDSSGNSGGWSGSGSSSHSGSSGSGTSGSMSGSSRSGSGMSGSGSAGGMSGSGSTGTGTYGGSSGTGTSGTGSYGAGGGTSGSGTTGSYGGSGSGTSGSTGAGTSGTGAGGSTGTGTSGATGGSGAGTSR